MKKSKLTTSKFDDTGQEVDSIVAEGYVGSCWAVNSTGVAVFKKVELCS